MGSLGPRIHLLVLCWAAALAVGPIDKAAGQVAKPATKPDIAPAARPWTALETEVHGLIFRIPRPQLHLRFGNGGFELGLRVADFSPIALLGLDNDVFWRDAMRVKVVGHSSMGGPSHVRRSLGTMQYLGGVQTTTAAPIIRDPFDASDARAPPAGLRYFPRPGSQQASPETERHWRPEQDLFMPDEPARSDMTGEELPEFIVCNIVPPITGGAQGRPAYPCVWNLVYRNLPLQIFLAREHLWRWQAIRAAVVHRLDSFLVGGPAEALTPPSGWRPTTVRPTLLYGPN